MVRSACLRVSNHEAERTAILRDARKGALLRMRTGSPFKPTDRQMRIGSTWAGFRISEISLASRPKSLLCPSLSRPFRGALANVINVGRDAVDAGSARDERGLLAYGQVVWFRR